MTEKPPNWRDEASEDELAQMQTLEEEVLRLEGELALTRWKKLRLTNTLFQRAKYRRSKNADPA